MKSTKRKGALIAVAAVVLLLVIVAPVATISDAVIDWVDARFYRTPPPPPTGHPTFDAIPYAIGLAVDDLGWRDWTPENSRDPSLADYRAVADVGGRAGTRIMTAWIMGDLDRDNVLAKPEYNQPIAPSNMTPLGTRWNNRWGVSPDAVLLMEMVRDQAAYIEFGLHGIVHQHYADRREEEAEFAHIDEANPGSAQSWGWEDMSNKAMAFEELVRQYYDEETSSFPRAFVPPGHAYYHGDDGRGSDESTGALLSAYGVKYANGDTGVATRLGEGGIDHGVLFIDRAYGCNYNWESCTPWVGDWNDFDHPDYPTAEYGWVEAHFPNLWDAEDDWVAYLRGLNDAPDRMLGRNTAQVSSQWLYRRYATVSGGEGTYTIDNTRMVEDAYTYDLLGALILKTPLAPGEHIQSADLDGGAQVLGYYEDGYGYGYLVIGGGTNPMGRLDRAAYTLESTLGSATMPAYVDLTGATYNVFAFEWGAQSASIEVEMYGAQDVRVKLPFVPAEVSSDNPDLEIVSWSWEAPFVTLEVQGRDIQGEVATIRIEGRPAWLASGEAAPEGPQVVNRYYVSTTGSDENDGSEVTPWRTIQHAVDSAGPGSTIYVKGGEYRGSVVFSNSGSAEEGYITLRNYPGHRPAIQGTGGNKMTDAVLIHIYNKHHVKIIGLDLGPLRASRGFPAAIWVLGAAHHVEIRDNYVHHVERDDAAHGIAVYGTAAEPAHDILVDGNEVAYCKLGASEAVVVNGNVEGFVISNNVIHDNNNIGIDVIGHEGVCADEALDRARDGVVVGNTVYNIDSLENGAYQGQRSADGIYVDGGTDVLIERNVVHHCNIGIEVASEWHGKDTSFVTVRNNFIYNSHTTGIALGGYDRRRGSTHHCIFVNNTLYGNDTDRTGSGEILVQFDTYDNVIKNNVLYANNQDLFISNGYAENERNVVDHNTYYGPGGSDGSTWQWKARSFASFAAWQSETGNDAHGLFADPLLVDPLSGDLHLRDGSPVIDAGETLPADLAGDRDVDGDPRVQGEGIDAGADERQ